MFGLPVLLLSPFFGRQVDRRGSLAFIIIGSILPAIMGLAYTRITDPILAVPMILIERPGSRCSTRPSTRSSPQLADRAHIDGTGHLRRGRNGRLHRGFADRRRHRPDQHHLSDVRLQRGAHRKPRARHPYRRETPRWAGCGATP
jgi:hypothetical protein